MTAACTASDRSVYETGCIAPGDKRVFRPGGMELTARAIGLAQFNRGAQVVDLGCGAGETVRFLRDQGFDATGVDSTSANCESQIMAAHIVARAETLPMADASVDAVLAECSFSLFANLESAIAECARILVDGGHLIITDLYARKPEAIAEVRALHSSCGSGMIVRDELEAMLVRIGFTVDVWEDHSRALRECAARYLFEHGSLDGMWGSACSQASGSIQAAMRAARAGYFLLVATRRRKAAGEESHE